MERWRFVTILAGSTAFALTAAVLSVGPPTTAQGGECWPTMADPATINQIDLPTGETYYVEERGSTVPFSPPILGSGFATGNGTRVYQERNGIWGLQRGGAPLLTEPPVADRTITIAADTPERSPSFPPSVVTGTPHLVLETTDEIMDETCGNGPDWYIGGILRPSPRPLPW